MAVQFSRWTTINISKSVPLRSADFLEIISCPFNCWHLVKQKIRSHIMMTHFPTVMPLMTAWNFIVEDSYALWLISKMEFSHHLFSIIKILEFFFIHFIFNSAQCCLGSSIVQSSGILICWNYSNLRFFIRTWSISFFINAFYPQVLLSRHSKPACKRHMDKKISGY